MTTERGPDRCPKCLQYGTVRNTGKPFPWGSTYTPPLVDAIEYTLWECTFIGFDLKTKTAKPCEFRCGRKSDGSHSRDHRMNDVIEPGEVMYARKGD